MNARPTSDSIYLPLRGNSPKLNSIFEHIDLVADTRATVLIEGESGTGKELIAKFIHYRSARSDKPLICINCGAIPEPLVESELFGYERGAFSGAIGNFKGKFEAAQDGTIFLDEVGELAVSTQVKLLRVLQCGEFTPLGTNESRKSEARIIAATNRNLRELIDQGYFRNDLFYRLNVISFQLPPLRERREDLPLLIEYFLHKFCNEYGRHSLTIAPSAEALLLRYSYPGNIRQLENIIQRAVLLCAHKEIHNEHLPEEVQKYAEDNNGSEQQPLTFTEAKILFEQNYLKSVLSVSDGVIREGARLAGMNYKNFYMKLKSHNINPNTFKSPPPN